jgi:hypothetical protein
MEFATASQSERGWCAFFRNLVAVERRLRLIWRTRDLGLGTLAAMAAAQTRAKKNPNERFGFNPPKEEVEETAEVAHLLQPMDQII